ncbi:T9SS type A sorting domain-containing protein [Flammeovirga sp. SJP92]|uniref:T9SS type A sorting domain-containing protein n=1 Tax=Flammeovirga sp. SJP92 TaxID=1775430 RepID=UPI0009EDBE96|nr:T9SS type A sorting domain-containing protein [Flammeovirga sp. SJP92]
MKRIIYITLVMILGSFSMSFAQNVSSLTLKCPPCRPFQGCLQCFETQAEADACSSSSRKANSLVEELSALEFTVYPNPSKTGVFTVETLKKIKGKVRIFSPLGSVVEEFEVNDQSLFQVGNPLQFTTGIYILSFTDESGQTITKKLMVSYK